MPPCIYSAHSQIVPYRSRSIPHKTVLFVYDSRNEKKRRTARPGASRGEQSDAGAACAHDGCRTVVPRQGGGGNRNATIDFMEKVALGLGVTLGQLFEGL